MIWAGSAEYDIPVDGQLTRPSRGRLQGRVDSEVDGGEFTDASDHYHKSASFPSGDGEA